MTRWSGYPQLRDIERLFPSGGLFIACDGTCEEYRRGVITKSGAHQFFGYSKRDALRLWRQDHTGGGER